MRLVFLWCSLVNPFFLPQKQHRKTFKLKKIVYYWYRSKMMCRTCYSLVWRMKIPILSRILHLHRIELFDKGKNRYEISICSAAHSVHTLTHTYSPAFRWPDKVQSEFIPIFIKIVISFYCLDYYEYEIRNRNVGWLLLLLFYLQWLPGSLRGTADNAIR